MRVQVDGHPIVSDDINRMLYGVEGSTVVLLLQKDSASGIGDGKGRVWSVELIRASTWSVMFKRHMDERQKSHRQRMVLRIADRLLHRSTAQAFQAWASRCAGDKRLRVATLRVISRCLHRTTTRAWDMWAEELETKSCNLEGYQ